MMYKLKAVALGLMATTAIILTSCGKDDPRPDDSGPAETMISITSPSENQVIEPGATVNIKGKIESPEELHGYKLIIRRLSDNSVQFEENKHTHGTVIDFDESWENTLEGHNDMELEVIAILDHDGNVISKKLGFHCHGH